MKKRIVVACVKQRITTPLFWRGYLYITQLLERDFRRIYDIQEPLLLQIWFGEVGDWAGGVYTASSRIFWAGPINSGSKTRTPGGQGNIPTIQNRLLFSDNIRSQPCPGQPDTAAIVQLLHWWGMGANLVLKKRTRKVHGTHEHALQL